MYEYCLKILKLQFQTLSNQAQLEDMLSLHKRSSQAELMDNPDVPFDTFKQTLEQIETINHLTFAYLPTLYTLKHFYYKYHKNQHPNKALRILDAGSGHGDYLREVYKWAQKNEIPVKLTGVDINPTSKKTAEMVLEEQGITNQNKSSIEFITSDIFKFEAEEKYDIIITSMFTHHLPDEMIIKLINWMTDNSNYGWHINDLHRHPFAYYSIKYFTKLFGFNELVKNDAAQSVAKAFTEEDWYKFISASEAEIEKTNIEWYWTFRYCITHEH